MAMLSLTFGRQIISRISLTRRKRVLNFFRKKRKNKKNLQGFINYYCPRCKNKQAIPNQMIYDFTKGKHSHPGGTTAFACTECGSPMRPMEKEDV